MKLRALAALIAVFAMVVAACSPQTDPTTTTVGPDPTTTAPPTPTSTTEPDPMADWPDKLVFGFVPSQEVSELQDDVDTLASILSDALGIEVEGIVTTDYTGLGVALGTGEADLGAFGPAGYVLAQRQYGNLELLAQSVRFGDATYHGIYFTNDPALCGDAGVEEGAFYYDDAGNIVPVAADDTPAIQVGYTTNDAGEMVRDEDFSAPLRCAERVPFTEAIIGKTMAFGSETSTSGYIFPNVALIEAGVTTDQYTTLIAGGHDAAVQAVYDGQADIGVAFDDARRSIRETAADVGEKVIVFDISPRIANDVIAVRADLPDSLKDAIFQALADFIATPEGQVVMDQLYSWTDLIRADAATVQSLEPIATAIDELGFSD
ncbi:MAG: PhnD/SsuA/transferrin family substrate-binding protein [Acidimicrobiia bacterium]|nr:PhnD/SsuA/transferrin family substrate-binding protein [Acidimicrobiia bacterium]